MINGLKWEDIPKGTDRRDQKINCGIIYAGDVQPRSGDVVVGICSFLGQPAKQKTFKGPTAMDDAKLWCEEWIKEMCTEIVYGCGFISPPPH